MNRPELFADMLRSLTRADGLADWHIYVNVEPGPDQDAFQPICAEILPADNFTIRLNRRVLGPRGNPYDAMNHAFAAGSELNICLEEDFQVAPDILHLALWYQDQHSDHLGCLNFLAGSCGNPGHLSDPDHPGLLFETKCFNSIGLALNRASWHRLGPAWLGPDPGVFGAVRQSRSGETIVAPKYMDILGWDWSVFRQILLDPDLSVLQPVAARCTHTGASGLFCHPVYQEQAFGHVRLADPATGGPDYRVCPLTDLPHPVRAHAESLWHVAELMKNLYDARYPKRFLPIRLLNHIKTRLFGHPLTRN